MITLSGPRKYFSLFRFFATDLIIHASLISTVNEVATARLLLLAPTRLIETHPLLSISFYEMIFPSITHTRNEWKKRNPKFY